MYRNFLLREGVVAEVSTNKSGMTFLNIGDAYPNQTSPAGFRDSPAAGISTLGTRDQTVKKSLERRILIAIPNIAEAKMQERELNCATIAVANWTDISGRATAEETNHGLRIGKGRSFGRAARLTILRSLIAVGFVVALAPLSAQADEEERGRHRKFEALEAKVESLQATVSALESQIDTLQKQLAVVQSNKALALGPFVSVVSGLLDGVNGPHIYFTGANIHIVSGSGSTDDNGSPRGLGNLIIGYDEDPASYVDRSPFNNLPLGPLVAGDRGGSHNLVIGAANRFTQATYGGLVVGTANTINGYGASVSGGAGNKAMSYEASVSGGFSNTAGTFFSSVSGGRYNTAVSFFASVSGGDSNTAGGGLYGVSASVSGGAGNSATGDYASVSGGTGNNAFDDFTSITGGFGNTAGSDVTFQGGLGSSVLGGSGNNAGGRNTVVIGGQNVTDNNDNSIAPKPPFP
jgi:hypothetical protein